MARAQFRLLLREVQRQVVSGPRSVQLRAQQTGCFLCRRSLGRVRLRRRSRSLRGAGVCEDQFAPPRMCRSSNVMVVNGLPLLLIATSFFGSERHAGRPCAIKRIKKNKKSVTNAGLYIILFFEHWLAAPVAASGTPTAITTCPRKISEKWGLSHDYPMVAANYASMCFAHGQKHWIGSARYSGSRHVQPEADRLGQSGEAPEGARQAKRGKAERME